MHVQQKATTESIRDVSTQIFPTQKFFLHKKKISYTESVRDVSTQIFPTQNHCMYLLHTITTQNRLGTCACWTFYREP